MSDEQARQKRRFEPPPWEQEAFEALARKRAEQHETELPATDGPAPKDPPLEPEPQAEAAKAAAKLDEDAVQAMLLQLRAQEASSSGGARRVGQIAAAITAVIGFGMVVVGLVALPATKGNTAGVIGSTAMSVFGLGFVGMAVWVWVSALRSKGIR
jgi:hypothetical protein